MSPDSREQLKLFLETLSNLNDVVDKVGGCGWSPKQLMDMSAFDLLCTLATNKVRFCYIDDMLKEKTYSFTVDIPEVDDGGYCSIYCPFFFKEAHNYSCMLYLHTPIEKTNYTFCKPSSKCPRGK